MPWSLGGGVSDRGWCLYASGMFVVAGRHAGLVAELAEWVEDLWQARTGSRAVLVKVPTRWGRITALDRFEEAAGDQGEEKPVPLTVRVDGQDLPGEVRLQAQMVRACLAAAPRWVLGFDTRGPGQLGRRRGGLWPGDKPGFPGRLARNNPPQPGVPARPHPRPRA